MAGVDTEFDVIRGGAGVVITITRADRGRYRDLYAGPTGVPGFPCMTPGCESHLPIQLVPSGDGLQADVALPPGWTLVRLNFGNLFFCPDHPYEPPAGVDRESLAEAKRDEGSFWRAIGPWLDSAPVKMVPFSFGPAGYEVEFGPLGRAALIRALDAYDARPVEEKAPRLAGTLVDLRARIEGARGASFSGGPADFDAVLALGISPGDVKDEKGEFDMATAMRDLLGSAGHAIAFMTIWCRMLATKKKLAQAALSPEHYAAARGSLHTFRSGATKVGRNDPCPCGSGKKFKRCCA